MRDSLFKKILIFFFIINLLRLIFTMFTGTSAMADELEHIHASWLVWNGQIPYIDFFEHHHSLIWYIFAPLVGWLEGNILVFFIIRGFILVCSLITLYIVFKLITKYLSDDTAAWLALNIFCFSSAMLNAMVQFKPDIFMHLFFWLGTYYLFVYINEKKQKQINISAICYTISFCFLQTALFLILPLIPVILILLYNRKLHISSCLKAAIFPIILLSMFLGGLWLSGSLQRYYELNWVVNSKISATLDTVKIVNFSDFYLILFCGLLSVGYLLYTKSYKTIYIIVLMYICELLLRTFYVSIALYYFKMLLLYNAILIGIALSRIISQKRPLAYIITLLFIPALFQIYPWQHDNSENKDIHVTTILAIITDITKNTSSNDTVLGTAMMPFGIYNQNPHYYWFSWDYIGKIDEELYHYAEPFDINKIITDIRPKFVYFEKDLVPNYTPQSQYDIDTSLLKQHYHNAKYNTLYLLNE